MSNKTTKDEGIPIRSDIFIASFCKIGRAQINTGKMYAKLAMNDAIDEDCLVLLLGVYSLIINQKLHNNAAILSKFETWIEDAEAIQTKNASKTGKMEKIALEFRNLCYRPNTNYLKA